jgi:NADH-quinone oxidoreductase subunit L
MFKSVDFSVMFSSVHLFVGESFYILGYPIDKITLLCFLLFIGAVGKSAQLGLHT